LPVLWGCDLHAVQYEKAQPYELNVGHSEQHQRGRNSDIQKITDVKRLHYPANPHND
jgi:hypothetical protein